MVTGVKKSAAMLIIERTYGQHIERLIWSDGAISLAVKWNVSRQSVHSWRILFPRHIEILREVRCRCGRTDLSYANDIVSCSCGEVTRWLTAHKRYILGK